MDGIPVTDPATGKVLCWDPKEQKAEWCNFSEVVEERMYFDECMENALANTTDEERRALEADCGLPSHFLDDNDHLFRVLSFTHYLLCTMRHVPKNHKDIPSLRLLLHELMVGAFKDVPLDDFAHILMGLVRERPDVAALLKGDKS